MRRRSSAASAVEGGLRSGAPGPAALDESHVRVVGRVGAEAVEEFLHPGLFVLGENGVRLPLPADGRLVGVRLGGGAERAEAVSGEDTGAVGEQPRQLVGRLVLEAGEVAGVLGAEQVGPAGGAVQQRTAGEHGEGGAVLGVGQGVAQMGEGVAGRGQRGHLHPWADQHCVAVPDRGALEGDVVVRVDVVGRPGGPREGQSAGQVVVVDVGLEDVGRLDPVVVEQGEYPVDVALRIDDESDLAVMDDVAPVAERGGLDGQHLDTVHVAHLAIPLWV